MKSEGLVVVPVYNEEKNLGALFDALKGLPYEVMLVNDGSSDSSLDMIIHSGIAYTTMQVNQGIGNIWKLGFEMARQRRIRKLLFMDADGQHLPADIHGFMEMLEHYPMVYGKRFDRLDGVPQAKIASNLFACCLIEALTGVAVPDAACGLRAFDESVIQNPPFHLDAASGYGVIYSTMIQHLRAGFVPNFYPIKAIYPILPIYGTTYIELAALHAAVSTLGGSALLASLAGFSPKSKPVNLILGKYEFYFEPLNDHLLKISLCQGKAEAYFQQFIS